MKRFHFLPALLVPVLAVSACGKDKDMTDSKDKPSSDKGAASDPKAPEKAGGPDFSSWNQDEKAKAWQGSWLAKENGRIQAWTISGDQVQVWDGEKEEAFTLVIEAPCKAGFKNDKHMVFPRNFTSAGGMLKFGSAGYRRGAEALFCDMSGDIYELAADGTCTRWDDDFGEWKKLEGECSIKKNDEGVEVFAHGDPNAGEFVIEGDAILPKASFPTEAVEGDFAAAKAARDAKASE